MIVTYENSSNSTVSLDIVDVDLEELKTLIKLQFVSYLEYAQDRGFNSYSSSEVDSKIVSWFERYDVNYLNKDDRLSFINQIMPEVEFGNVSVSSQDPPLPGISYNDTSI